MINAYFMGPRHHNGRSRLHESFRSKSLACTIAILLGACATRPTSERPVPAQALIPETSQSTQLTVDIGEGTHVVVARGTTLFADVERKTPAISLAQKENVIFRRGQIIGGSVEVLTSAPQPGACHNEIDSLSDHDLRFWVTAADLVSVAVQDVELEGGKWQLTAHPGVEIIDGYAVHKSFRGNAPNAVVGLSFVPHTPEGHWASFPDAEFETPFPVGRRSANWDRDNPKTVYWMLDRAQVDAVSIRIDEACFTLMRSVEGALFEHPSYGVGGLSMMGSSKSTEPRIAKGAMVYWQDGGVAGRLLMDIWLYDSWQAAGKICSHRKFAADANIKEESVVLCYDVGDITP